MTETLADGTYTEVTPDSSTEIVAALTAAGAGGALFPPREWFQNPDLGRPTPIAVTADGKIYGHIAPWNVEHTGMPGVKPPRSPSNYAFFRTGVVMTKEGDEVPVGQVTLAGGHCNDLTAGAGAAVKHYDDTSSAVADVNIGEDMHGIWVAGALRPNVTDDQVRSLRASAPSGDWRPINGSRELIAICQVNHPGFPVARAVVASGEIQAVVGAGASAMYSLRQQETVLAAIGKMDDRLTRLEDDIANKKSSKATTASQGTFVFNVSTGGTDTIALTAAEKGSAASQAQRMIRALHYRGLSNEEIAREVGWSAQAITQISSGEMTNVPTEVLEKLQEMMEHAGGD